MKPGKPLPETISSINGAVARCFDEIADLLEHRRSTDFRITTYRRGAAIVRELLCSVDRIVEDSGREGLEQIPQLGRSLAISIEKFIQTGFMPTLEVLRGNGLSRRFMRTENSPRRKSALRDLSILDVHQAETLLPPRKLSHASVSELLSVDAEYRRKSTGNQLVRVAPRQFNPTGAKWLPILHAERNGWHYTATFSNTAHAHKVGRTSDWVIIHCDAGRQSGQWTVITSSFGTLKDRRIVRGREADCERFYRQHPEGVAVGEGVSHDNRSKQKLLFDLE